jgi:prefoldin subunit 5
MKHELVEPIHKLNSDMLVFLKGLRELVAQDRNKALEMLDSSIDAISATNDKLSAMSQVQQIIKKVEKEYR